MYMMMPHGLCGGANIIYLSVLEMILFGNESKFRNVNSSVIRILHHEISIIVTSILTVLTVFRRKLDLCSLLIVEIMAIHSWKSQYISVWFLVIYCVIC
jgi:hypothetical protein